MILNRISFYILVVLSLWPVGLPAGQGIVVTDGLDRYGLGHGIVSAAFARDGGRVCFQRQGGGHVWLNTGGRGRVLVRDGVMAVYKKVSFSRWDGVHSMDYCRGVGMEGAGFGGHGVLSGVQFSRWRAVGQRRAAWHALNLDLADVIIDTQWGVDGFLEANDMDRTLYGMKLLWEDRMVVGFRETVEGRALKLRFERGMAELVESGELGQLYEKWGRFFDRARWEER